MIRNLEDKMIRHRGVRAATSRGTCPECGVEGLIVLIPIDADTAQAVIDGCKCRHKKTFPAPERLGG